VSASPEGPITLEFEADEPIQGTLRDQQGDRHPFRGWLELCAAIDQAWLLGKDESPEDGPAHPS
jgi:hypothetical protein